MEKKLFNELLGKRKSTSDPFLAFNGTKKKNSKPLVKEIYTNKKKDPLIELFGMQTPKKMPSSKVMVSDAGLKSIMGSGNYNPNVRSIVGGKYNPDAILGKGVSPNQKRFLKKTRVGSGKSHQRFWDIDGDGVIGGLDCEPYNPKEHGFLSKTKNLFTGKGFREDEEYEMKKLDKKREVLRQAKDTAISFEEASAADKGRFIEIDADRAAKEAAEKGARLAEKQKMFIDQGLDPNKDKGFLSDYMDYEEAQKQKIMAKMSVDGPRQVFEMGKKKTIDSFDMDSINIDFDKKEQMKKLAEREARESAEREMLKSKIKESASKASDVAGKFAKGVGAGASKSAKAVGTGASRFKSYLDEVAISKGLSDETGTKARYTQPFSKLTDYAFEKPEVRAQYRELERSKQLERARQIIGADRYSKLMNISFGAKGGQVKQEIIGPDGKKMTVTLPQEPTTPADKAKVERLKEDFILNEAKAKLRAQDEAESKKRKIEAQQRASAIRKANEAQEASFERQRLRPLAEAELAQRLRYAQLQRSMSEANLRRLAESEQMAQSRAGMAQEAAQVAAEYATPSPGDSPLKEKFVTGRAYPRQYRRPYTPADIGLMEVFAINQPRPGPIREFKISVSGETKRIIKDQGFIRDDGDN
jgi:hypothetical protein